MSQQGLWFDGRSALERPVTVVAEPAGIALVDEAGERHSVAAEQLVRLDGPLGQVRFGHRSVDGWRLLLREPVEAALAAVLPSRRGSLTGGVGPRTMTALIALTAAVSLVIALVVFAPGVLAERMPMSWERKLGAAYDLPIDAARCENPRTRAALDALVDRIDPAARADGFRLDLVPVDMVNAVALPGGRMVLFQGMVTEADDVDAVAGVIAHEIAHVRRRHVATAMVRDMGLGAVITILGGGAVAGSAGDLLTLRFSRSAEAEADADAVEMLRRARISPRPTAEFFREMSRLEAGGPASEFLSSHPLSEGRARLFAKSHDSKARYEPALDTGHAAALARGCGD